MKYSYIGVLLGIISCFVLRAANNGDVFTIISIPKSGTHLIAKFLKMLTNKNHGFAGHHIKEKKYIQNLKVSWGKNTFCHCHLLYSERNEQLLKQNNIKLFLMIRDPRDQVISFAYYAPKIPGIWPQAKNLSIDQMIQELIVSPSFYKALWPGIKGVNNFYRSFLPWMCAENVCVVKFEDLVGPQGGGTLEAQFAAMRMVANHLEMYPSDVVLFDIALRLFGKNTFRAGQIGSWKTHFKEEHKKAFKEIAGQLLIDLGYEKDFNW